MNVLLAPMPPVGVTAGGFPTALFTIEGDPGAMRSSVRPYRTFARAAAGSAQAVHATSLDSWVGSEGDVFRSRRSEFVPMLRTATDAFVGFATAVDAFADTFEGLIRRMNALRARAQQVWAQLQAARAAETAARLEVSTTQLTASLSSGVPSPALERAQQALGAAAARASALESQWEECVREAQALHQQVGAAEKAVMAAIRALPHPPQAPAPSVGGATASVVPVAQTPPLPEPQATDAGEEVPLVTADGLPVPTPEQAQAVVGSVKDGFGQAGSAVKDFLFGGEVHDGKGGNPLRDALALGMDAAVVQQTQEAAAYGASTPEMEQRAQEAVADANERFGRAATNVVETAKGLYNAGVYSGMQEEAAQARLIDPVGAERHSAASQRYYDQAKQHLSDGTFNYTFEAATTFPIGGAGIKTLTSLAERLAPRGVPRVAAGKSLPGLSADAPRLAARGSTGRVEPRSLTEQIVMREVREHPRGRPVRMTKPMGDPRWPASEGWVKMEQKQNGVIIHYVKNEQTGQVDDFKFKDVN